MLAHRRLAVLDPTARADQPMRHANGQVLVYNGEVYSFPAVRAALAAAGRRVASSGDTEVVLAALVEWGEGALDRFTGMFALALWEPAARRLLLVRDRLGVKPLFWAPTRRGLAFASELAALLEHPEVGRDLAPGAVPDWLQLGYLPGDRTLLAGVHKLPPGHLLSASDGALVVRPWYDLAAATVSGPLPTTVATAAEWLEPTVREAVRLRLVSDVPLGCFLSAGVDSTAVVAAAVAEGARPDTLTVSFPGGADESAGAARTARALGLDHRVVACAADDGLALLERWTAVASDPLADPSLVPTWLVARAARERWTVALSGDGGDEAWSGYPRLRLMPRLAGWRGRRLAAAASGLLPARRWGAKLTAALVADDDWAAYQALQGVWPLAAVRRLCPGAEVGLAWPVELRRRLEREPPWRRFRLLDLLTFLPERVLAKVDRASMDRSLEVRVPLLDHRLVAAALAVPARLAQGKAVLRKVVERLGAPAPARAKRGFEVPLGRWLRGPLQSVVAADLGSPLAAELGLAAEVIDATWRDHLAGRADHAERLLAVVVLLRWARALR